jgi:nucleotide-binding universal stress UspA family protein
LQDVAELAAGQALDVEAELLEGDIVSRILEDAAQWRADAIVIGMRAQRHTFTPRLGSKAHGLLRRSTVPVLICP